MDDLNPNNLKQEKHLHLEQRVSLGPKIWNILPSHITFCETNETND